MKIKRVCNASAQEVMWGTEENEDYIHNILWRDELDRKGKEHVPMTAFVKVEKKFVFCTS